MPTEFTWLGHNCWSIATAGKVVLLDPFLDHSPTAPVKADKVAADFILISHGHEDHTGDVVKIARKTGATVISNFEICQWLKNKGVHHTVAMNLGGAYAASFGRVKMTLAHHSSALPDGSYGGNPAGFLLSLAEGNVYFACDTGLFRDMQEIGAAGLALAVVPIGDLFTMGPDDAVTAVKWLKPRRVAPSHYNTFPPIAQDAAAWAARVKAETVAEPVVLAPGEKITL